MISRQILLTISRRVASAGIILRGQQPARRSSIFLPKRWILPSSHRTLSSSTTAHGCATRKLRASALVVTTSALGAMLLYHQTPARMDSLRDRADAAKKTESTEKLPFVRNTPNLIEPTQAFGNSEARQLTPCFLGAHVTQPQRTRDRL